MSARVMERDVQILVKCALCRWLTTAQVQRLYFPEASLNAVQKRLRKLSDAGHLRSYREHPTAEAVHAVGPKGQPLVEGKGIEVALGGDVPKQLEHLLGINEIRIAVETGKVPVAYFFPYWQLASLGWTCQVIPDAVFACRIPERRAFVVEYDRGTETLAKLLDKLKCYDDGLGGFVFEAVLLFTEGKRRLDLLSRQMRRSHLSLTVLAATIEGINEMDFFASEFTELPGGVKRKLLLEPDED
jgi:protein involved in plasmid replication-relaxation